MHWTVIDTNDDLQKLNELVDWEDSEGIEYYASEMNEDYFPVDVSRSGRLKKNIHLLCRTCSSQGPYLELVFIDCDLYDGKFLEEPFLHGRVDILKRVEIENK